MNKRLSVRKFQLIHSVYIQYTIIQEQNEELIYYNLTYEEIASYELKMNATQDAHDAS